MAQITAVTALNMLDINFNNVYSGAFGSNVYSNYSYNGNFYPNVLDIGWTYGSNYYASLFGGSGLTYTFIGQERVITGGTVTGFLQMQWNGSDFAPSFLIEGVSISATSLYSTFLTPSSADDFSIILQALRGADLIIGSSDNDFLYGAGGSDTIDGGLGFDQVGYLGNRADYRITKTAEGFTVQDLRAGSPDGTDTLRSIESFAFLDGNVLASSFDSGSTPIYGTGGNDSLSGTLANDTISGLSGSDTIFGGAGNDQINGGDGIDTAQYAGRSQNFSLEYSRGGLSVDDRTGAEGLDSLSNIELVRFSDRLVDLTYFYNTATLSQQQVSNLVELYIASFNRAPDAFGLNYWGSQFASGAMDLGQIAKSFFVQPETIAAYPASQSTSYFVTKVYNNVLSRGPEQAGLNYWIDAIDSGRISKDVFLLAIINGAKAISGGADDKLTLINKTSVGMDYAFTEGLSNTVWASDVMSGVNSTADSVLEAKAKTDGYAIAAASDGTAELAIKILGVWDPV